jgi:hypothetical protein
MRVLAILGGPPSALSLGVLRGEGEGVNQLGWLQRVHPFLSAEGSEYSEEAGKGTSLSAFQALEGLQADASVFGKLCLAYVLVQAQESEVFTEVRLHLQDGIRLHLNLLSIQNRDKTSISTF